jgi:hypothetical protein
MAVGGDFGMPNPPVRFEQDPDSPDGTGTFHFQDGSSLFAHEPELAQRVSAPDERTANNDSQQSKAGYWLDAPVAAPQEAPSRLDAGGGLMAAAGTGNAHAAPSGPLPGSYGPGGRLNVAGVVPDKPLDELLTSGAPAPQFAPDPAAAAALHRRLAAGPPGAEALPAPAPLHRPWVGGRAGGTMPVSSTMTVESQGAPYSYEDMALRERANQQVAEAQLAGYAAQKAEAEARGAAMRAAIPELRQKEAEGRAELSKLDQNYRDERSHVRSIIEGHDRQAKPDPNRFYKRAGTGGQIAMVIGQALGAYAAILGHSDNFAQKLVSEAQDRDMRAQEDEIASGRVGDNNLLARLRDQFGDLDQAKSALKLVQSDLLDREIKSFADQAQSAAATRAAALWLAQNQQERLKEEQRFRDLAIGKQTMKTDAKIVTPSAGHYATDEELMRQQLKQNKLKGDLMQSENELGYQRQGGEQADKLTKRANASAGKHAVPRGLIPVATAADSTLSMGDKILNAYGVKEGDDVGYLRGKALGARAVLDQSRQRDIDSNLQNYYAEVHKMITGASPTESDKKEFEHRASSWSPAQIINYVNNSNELARHKQQFIEQMRGQGQVGGGDEPTDGGER